LVLNLEKTNIKNKQIICHTVKNNLSHYSQSISYKEKCMEDTLNTKFLGLQTDKDWNVKKHIEEIIKLSGACYAVKEMFHIINTNSLSNQFILPVFSL